MKKKHTRGEVEVTKVEFDEIGGNICYPYYRTIGHARVWVDDKKYYKLSDVAFHQAPEFDDGVREFFETCDEKTMKKIDRCEEGEWGKSDKFWSSISDEEWRKYQREYARECVLSGIFDEINGEAFVDDENYRSSIAKKLQDNVDCYNNTIKFLKSPESGIYQMG